MAAKKVKNAKITIGEKDEEYWRKNPKRFRSMLRDIAESEDYLRSVGGMDMLEPEDDPPRNGNRAYSRPTPRRRTSSLPRSRRRAGRRGRTSG